VFAEDYRLEIFQTGRKDGRIIKLSGGTPMRALYYTIVRMRREYKYMLELNFNRKMMDKVNPDFMHFSYFDQLVPSYFT
jgi:hypothetical protein